MALVRAGPTSQATADAWQALSVALQRANAQAYYASFAGLPPVAQSDGDVPVLLDPLSAADAAATGPLAVSSAGST